MLQYTLDLLAHTQGGVDYRLTCSRGSRLSNCDKTPQQTNIDRALTWC